MTRRERRGASLTRDGSRAECQIDTIAAPASWATALVNGDWSALESDLADAEACRAWIAEQAKEGWRVVDVTRDADNEPEDAWFSWSADLHGSPYRGADLLTYVRVRCVTKRARRRVREPRRSS